MKSTNKTNLKPTGGGQKKSTNLAPPVKPNNKQVVGANSRRRIKTRELTSEEKFRRLFEMAQEGILLIDADTGVITETNPFLEKMLVYTKAEMVGKKLWEIGPFEDMFANQDAFRVLQIKKNIRYKNLPLESKDGRRCQVEFVSNVYRMGGQKVIQCSISDITDRAQEEEEIIQLAKFPSENPNPVLRMDRAGRTLYANEASRKILDEWGCDIGGQAPKFWQNAVSEVFEKQATKVIETQCGDRFYSFFIAPVADAKYVNLYGSDETERKRAEEKLQASESELRTLFAAMQDVILILDKNGCYLKIVPTDPKVLFKPADEIIGKYLHEVFPKKDADLFLHQIRTSLGTGQTIHFEYALPIQEQIVWFSASVSPTTANSVMWVARDITEKKQAEALQEAVYQIASATETTRSLDDLFPQIHQIISSVMPAEDFYITLFDELHNTLQFPYNTDTVDKPFVEEVQGGKGITAYVLKTGKSLLCTKAVHDELERQGDVIFVGVPAAIWLGVPLIIKGKPIGVMVVQHYTDPNAYTEREQHMLEYVSTQVAIAITRKQAEQALENSEAELRALFAAMTDVVIVYDREGRYIKVAPTDPGLLIEPPEQLIGKSIYDVFPKIDADRLSQHIRTVLETGKKMETEYFLEIGEHKTWFACTISPMQVDSVIWVAHDITNRKRTEKIQEVMYSISRAAISTESIDELYLSIHKFLGELIHVENFYIALYDPSSDLIHFPYYVDQYDEPPLATKPGHGLTEYIMRKGQPLLVPREILDQLIQRGEVEAIGTMSIDWLGAPLKVEGQVIGVMVTQSYQEKIHFDQEDLRLFEFVSTQVAQMIDRKRIEEKVRYMGIHDSLTGLYNRAYFDEELKRLEHGRQFPVSILMADLDDLKDVNDIDGHAAGDELLHQAAKALRAAFRIEDVVARIGGDEFAVLLPGIDARMAEKAKLRITDNIKMENATRMGKPIQISMGVSTAEKGGSLVEALKMADDQMYAEKQSKRLSA